MRSRWLSNAPKRTQDSTKLKETYKTPQDVKNSSRCFQDAPKMLQNTVEAGASEASGGQL
eukprot:1053620-Karenia_brevis.AAC.1